VGNIKKKMKLQMMIVPNNSMKKKFWALKFQLMNLIQFMILLMDSWVLHF